MLVNKWWWEHDAHSTYDDKKIMILSVTKQNIAYSVEWRGDFEWVGKDVQSLGRRLLQCSILAFSHMASEIHEKLRPFEALPADLLNSTISEVTFKQFLLLLVL